MHDVFSEERKIPIDKTIALGIKHIFLGWSHSKKPWRKMMSVGETLLITLILFITGIVGYVS